MDRLNHFFVHVEQAMLTGGDRLYGVPDDFCDYLRADSAAFEIIPIDSAQDFFCHQGGQFFNLSILTHLPYSAAIGAKINAQLSSQCAQIDKNFTQKWS